MFLLLIFVALFGLATSHPARDRRYALYKYKWSKCTLAFRFHDSYQLFRNESDYQTARQTISEAFKIWETASNQRLHFIDASTAKMRDRVDEENSPNIDISFAKRDHGCMEELDGPGGIGKLDADENWNIDGMGDGPDLRYVALHEIGHVLGIKHSENPNSVMSPLYRDRRERDFSVSPDDIDAIRQLYAHCT